MHLAEPPPGADIFIDPIEPAMAGFAMAGAGAGATAMVPPGVLAEAPAFMQVPM